VSKTTYSLDENIVDERRRQIDQEGYTEEHDRGHALELLAAADCYLRESELVRARPTRRNPKPPYGWPWEERLWKPASETRMRQKAGALALAAVEAIAQDGTR
jgi:hypothetical protein